MSGSRGKRKKNNRSEIEMGWWTDPEFSCAGSIRNTESRWFDTICWGRRERAVELGGELVLELSYTIGYAFVDAVGSDRGEGRSRGSRHDFSPYFFVGGGGLGG